MELAELGTHFLSSFSFQPGQKREFLNPAESQLPSLPAVVLREGT